MSKKQKVIIYFIALILVYVFAMAWLLSLQHSAYNNKMNQLYSGLNYERMHKQAGGKQ